MNIVVDKPPIYDAILAHGMHPHSGVVYTYGDTLYNPGNRELVDHVIAHEETHSKQQGDKPEMWWARYLNDQYFRIAQEAEAYAAQYRFFCKHRKDRNQRSRFLHTLAISLSSQIYGSVITYKAATDMIREKSHVV